MSVAVPDGVGLSPDASLLDQPMWRPEDAGRPLPDEIHAVSVCLPTWDHVLAYEQGDAALVDSFFTGYPRFCCHRFQQQLFDAAVELADPGEGALVFPSMASAERCVDFLQREGFDGARAVEWSGTGFAITCYPERAHGTARLYWRYSGEVIGSRRAASVLAGLGRTGIAEESGTGSDPGGARGLIRQRLAKLAGGDPEGVFLFPSGMAAMAAVQRVLTAARPGLPTLQVDFPYVDVFRVQQNFGSGAHLNMWRTDSDERALFEQISKARLAAVYAETPSNPLLRCVDLPRLSEATSGAGVPLVVDDTIGAPLRLEVLPFADAVTASLTKYFSGAGNVMAGSVMVNPDSPFAAIFMEGLRTAETESGSLADGDARVLEKNSRNFNERMDVINRTTAQLVDRLRQRPGLTIHYPGSEAGCGRLMRKRENNGHEPGFGGLFSIVLDDPGRAARFFDALRVSKGPSLGTNFTLACPYTLLAHYDELEWAAGCGVPAHLIRVSVGLEPADDLCRRFDNALEAAR